MKNARAKRAKILFFIVKYANLWGFCYRRRRGCLSSLLFQMRHRFVPIMKSELASRKTVSFGDKERISSLNLVIA